jgi:hypothetical protein
MPGRVNSRLSISYQQRSPYYWWWQYLRRNEEYIACCERGGKGKLAALYADFGDVRDDNFHKWWTTGERGARLFAEQPLTVKFGELTASSEWQTNWDTQSVMVVSVPLAMSKRAIKGAFAKLLDSRHTGNKSGRPSMARLKDSSTAHYTLEHNYTISSLMTALVIYDKWHANQQLPKANQLTLWEIGKACNINRQAAKDAESRESNDRLVGRNILTAAVSRYVRQAKAMINHTAQGKFPMTK